MLIILVIPAYLSCPSYTAYLSKLQSYYHTYHNCHIYHRLLVMTKKLILLLKPLLQQGWGKEQVQKKECSKADRLEKVSHNPFPISTRNAGSSNPLMIFPWKETPKPNSQPTHQPPPTLRHLPTLCELKSLWHKHRSTRWSKLHTLKTCLLHRHSRNAWNTWSQCLSVDVFRRQIGQGMFYLEIFLDNCQTWSLKFSQDSA